MSPLDELVVFDLCPLDEKRVEVVITFHGFEKHIRPVRDDLLRAIKERWPGVAIQEEIADETEEATLRRLWADESLTKEEIADQMGYSPDWVDHQKAKLALPDRTRGRKKGKSSPHLK